MSNAILEIACHHHVYELICGAVSEFVLGKSSRTKDKKSTALYEPLFKKLCSAWNDISTDSGNIKVLDTKNFPCTLLHHIKEAKQFLKVWQESDTVIRHDYLEMAKLCYVYLGGILPQKFMPFSANYHAR